VKKRLSFNWRLPLGGEKAGEARPAKDPEATWPRSYLWNGAVPTHGISAISLVGSPEEIACAVMEYKEIGVSQFIFSGWPNTDALIHFGEEVLPLIREREAHQ